MDTGSALSIGVLVVLVGLSAFFSATETAFSSFNRIRMKNLAEGGNKKAKTVLALTEDYGKFLSTVLVGNNIVNIASTSIATVLFIRFLGDAGPTVSTIVMTVVVLIFGEISPKTLAQESPEKIAMGVAPVIRVFVAVLTPVNWLFSQWKKLLAKLFKTGDGPAITEEELLTMVDEAEQEGAIDEEDKDLIRSAIEFNDCNVSEILTPRVNVEGVSTDADADGVARLFMQTGYTRLPVYEGSLDKIVGVLNLHDFFGATRKGPRPVTEVMTPVIFTSSFTKISVLLKTLQKAKIHMAVVVDEYGGTMGIVTLEDILEELVGEIWDEHDEVLSVVQKRADGAFVVAGGAGAEEVFGILGIDGRPSSNTVSGWIAEQLGRIPKKGDEFTYENICVQVTEAGHNRVEESVFTLVPTVEEGGEEEEHG